MRKIYLFFFIALLSQTSFGQFVRWTFETSIPTTAGPHAAELGTGNALGFHAGATTYSNPAGNGSVESFSSTNWAVGDYYQFQFASTGFQDLILSWDAISSGTGPRDFKIQYSTDGFSFTDATGTNSTYQVGNTPTWSSATYNATYTRTLDLSGVTALNNAATVYIRMTVTSTTSSNGATILSGGTSRVDNISVSGNVFSSNTLTQTTLSSTTFSLPDCFTGVNGTVDFTSTGTFNGPNVYTAELSDATGSFAAPVAIGTLASTANLGTINFTIPAGTVTGTLYKIRIRSSDPAVTSNLSADISINLPGSCASSTTDYFRSRATGNWNAVSTWESSPTGLAGSWINATLTPTNAANTISILNGHTVSVTASVSVDQVVIENGGTINHTGGTITVEDGTGDDIDIQTGGILRLALASTPPAYGAGTPTVNVATGGILRVSAGGMTGAGTGVNANNIVYQHQSILEWAPTGVGSFSTGGVTYFPNVDAVTIPIFRSSNTSAMRVGATANTLINGVFESANANVTWEGTGTKTFRNGIRGTGNVVAETIAAPLSGMFIINGATAELGGTGSLTVPVTGLEIGSATGTTVTVSDNKVVTGNISLVSTNTFVDLGTSNLTVTGTISGGTATSYIRTAGTGALILNGVDVAGKTFPVGHTQYNPIVIANGSNHNWTVNVNDGVVADLPQTTAGAVLLTWNITPSVNPPSAGADITFQFDAVTQTGGSFNVPPYDTEPIQPWHRKFGYWLASGTTVPLVNIGGNLRTVTATGLTQFSPYGLARMSLPLPLKLISFNAVKVNSSMANLSWELAGVALPGASFEVEKSADGRSFTSFSTLPASTTNRFYFLNDTRLGKGVTYYRLKMIDADGKITYGKVVAVINDKTGIYITNIAPNPLTDKSTLTLSAAKAGTVTFEVYSLSGVVVKRWNAAVAEGTNIITMQAGELPAGIYQLVATGQEARAVTRFVKQ